MDIETLNKVIEIFTKVLIIFLVLPIHEFAHAWAAHKMGDDTAAYSGRLTLNPLAHIDIIGAICLLLTGFGWAKPVPINPLKFKKQRFGISITAAAGPLSNLIVAFIALIIDRLIRGICSMPDFGYYMIDSSGTISSIYILIFILEFFVQINIGLAIFNLIPIPPLDGSKILNYFTPAKWDRWVYEHQMIVNLIFLGVIATGILTTPLSFIRDYILDFFLLITNFIPKLMGA